MQSTFKLIEQVIEQIIFASRWIQAPIYLGLVAGAVVYCIKFIEQLLHMVWHSPQFGEEEMMLAMLGLVDTTMVINLVYMVLVGGYGMFVSKMDLRDHPDRPAWLDHTNSTTLKIKLISALIGVSGIHLLKTFIEMGGHVGAATFDESHIKWQVLIHLTFLVSSIALAYTDRLMHPPKPPKPPKQREDDDH
jgi:uncharacterized protein (TIGR00645 family)